MSTSSRDEESGKRTFADSPRLPRRRFVRFDPGERRMKISLAHIGFQGRGAKRA